MKALGLVVSDKKIFENCILKTYFLTPWPTYVTNWNGLNNFERGPPRDHSCEVWSKSNKWFQRRCCLKKLLTHGRTHGRWTTDNGLSQKFTLSTLCSGELKTNSDPISPTYFKWLPTARLVLLVSHNYNKPHLVPLLQVNGPILQQVDHGGQVPTPDVVPQHLGTQVEVVQRHLHASLVSLPGTWSGKERRLSWQDNIN